MCSIANSPSAALIALARADQTRAPTIGWPESLSRTAPRIEKPPNAKWYQATPPTRSSATGNGLIAGKRGSLSRRRRYADAGGDPGSEEEYDHPRFEYMQKREAHLRMSAERAWPSSRFRGIQARS